jgi:protein-tyrosine phosphatase
MTRTSSSHPLRIAVIPVGNFGGAIGVTFAPGKKQAHAMTGTWSRDLDLDLHSIRDWGAQYLISLLEPWEFEELKIQELPQRAQDMGLVWHGLPITDGAAPDERFTNPWKTVGPELVKELMAGSRIVVHCKGGLGRAGTVASILLLESATASSFEDAINMVRAVRPGAIETIEQVKFLNLWAASIANGIKSA